ncbi:MAG: PepSY domain-containing protein [Dongiaceae bacterium]
MTSRRSVMFGLLGLLAMAGAPLPTAADSHQNRNSFSPEGQGGGGCLPLKSVIRSVRQQFGGRVLDADRGGGGVYLVRLLTGDGQVLDIAVDCASGQVLGVRGG